MVMIALDPVAFVHFKISKRQPDVVQPQLIDGH